MYVLDLVLCDIFILTLHIQDNLVIVSPIVLERNAEERSVHFLEDSFFILRISSGICIFFYFMLGNSYPSPAKTKH